ncbi:MAG: hypothetical protein ACD_21C00122G0015 [uncultured bacterium]|nr:MAG: hypothetical protein ACD_21C00122G0015 [uncultured bacterium]
MPKCLKIVILNMALCLFVFNATAIKAEEDVISKKDLQRLTTMINNVKQYYYKSIDKAALLDMAISGMLAGLDPHSEYLGPEALRELELETRGKFGGIGVLVAPDRGAIKVIAPLDDTPAYRADIKAGDYIVQINNKFVRDMTLSDAVGMMRGAKGSKLNLTIIRKNESKPRIISLRREIIKVKSVKDDKLLEPGYGYIRLSVFQESTAQDMIKAINKLQKASKGNLKGLILDVRNNPGGLFDSAVQVADDFLDSTKLKGNDLIVYTKGQDEQAQLIAKATAGELLPNVPVVVLINEGSASAAEIVAGALQDHKRAIIVGTRSFGKGSVQVLIPIDRSSAIKLTTSIYYTPLGHSIQAKGIEPDINVEDIQIPQDKDAQSLPRVDESALVDHIQNGDEESDSLYENKKPEDQQKQSKAESKLVHQDYQLYEALHILKSLSVMKNKST